VGINSLAIIKLLPSVFYFPPRESKYIFFIKDLNKSNYFIKKGIIEGKETVFECLSFLQAKPISNKGALTLWENYDGNSIRMKKDRLFSVFIPLKILWTLAFFCIFFTIEFLTYSSRDRHLTH